MKGQLAPSIWESLKWNQPWDLIVVGGGITGVNTAIHFKRANPKSSVLIIEALPSGNVASTKNAGFACFGSIGELREDLESIGEDGVKDLLHFRYEGLQLLKDTIEPKLFDYRPCGGFELFDKEDDTFLQENLGAIDELNDLIKDALGLEGTFMVKQHGIASFALSSTGIFNRYEGALNPIKMMDAFYKVVSNLRIELMRGLQVVEILPKEHQVRLANDQVLRYNQLALCTNGMVKNFLPKLDIQTAPNMVAYAKLPEGLVWPSCYHMDRGYTYFRAVEDKYVILGGGRHILEDKLSDDEASDLLIQQYLNQRLHQLLGSENFKVEAYWKGYLGVGSERFPILESIGDDIYCGVRLGGMGVAIGSYLGRSLAEMMKA